MKVIVDDKIPYINTEIEQIADEVVYLPGAAFTPEKVKDADALIVRTRTHCNEKLLKGSNVKFIATATIGYDHIDTEYCEKNGIFRTNAPGCNSGSVAQYIHSSLLLLERKKNLDLSNMCIGIIGVGSVGSKIEQVAHLLGMKVLLNDPPRGILTSLNTIAHECDIITFHTPLNTGGEHPTYHLANQDFFDSLQKSPIIINTSRGEVVDTNALLNAYENEKINEMIIDVWENEPDINLTLLQKAFIATPHIAGYSADGKANATRMSLEALCNFFHINHHVEIYPPAPNPNTLYAKNEADAYLMMYNPEDDSKRLKEQPDKFEYFRGNYSLRREKDAYKVMIE